MTNDTKLSPQRLVGLGRVGAVVPSPDGKWLAVAVSKRDDDGKKFISQLWRVWIEGDGNRPAEPITAGDDGASSPCFRSDGSLGFLRKVAAKDKPLGRDKIAQVFLLTPGSEAVQLTSEPLGVTDFRFAKRADRLVVVTDKIPGTDDAGQAERAAELGRTGPSLLRYKSSPMRHWDHWLEPAAPRFIAYDGDGGGRTPLTGDQNLRYRDFGMGFDWDVSPDGSRVAALASSLAPDRQLDVAIDLIATDSGAVRTIGAGAGLTHDAPRFSPSSKQLACTRNQRVKGQCGRFELTVYDLETEGSRDVATGFDTWLSPAAWVDDRHIVATADWHGAKPVFLVACDSGDVERISSVAAGGSHAQVSYVGGDQPVIVGSRSSLLAPPEPFALDTQPGSTPRRLANLSGFTEDEGAAIARVSERTTKAPDGADVHWHLLSPNNASGDRPGVISIHGGPISSWADVWHWRWNALAMVDAGYALALPNPRGSTGFGQKFIEGIWNNQWGAECYDDLIAVADDFAATTGVDGTRMAAMGGSFGGYMTNWIGTQTDRFRCLITHASIFHFPAFHGATDHPPFWVDEIGSSPWTDPEAFSKYSPHRFIDRWKSPVLIIHGEKDYRCPISDALILFEGLQSHGVDAELAIYPDENHWILSPSNSRSWYEMCLAYLGERL